MSGGRERHRSSEERQRPARSHSSRQQRRPRGRSHGTGAVVLAQTEGVLSAHRAGYGFVRTDELVESVFLPPPQMRGLMHGDRLRVRVRADAQGRYLGEVLEVLERGVRSFLGTVEGGHRGPVVRAADQRFGHTCRITGNEVGARPGDWVIARLTRYPSDGEQGEAVIERVLDPKRPVDLATEAAIARFALPVEFLGRGAGRSATLRQDG